MINRLTLAAVLLLLFSSFAHAELRLAQIFQDDMVLQRDLKAPVWGWADAGAAVKVRYAGQEKTATADDKGKWLVTLDPLAIDAKGQPLVVSAGDAKIERKSVLVGEVWVLAGQSNMARGLANDAFDYPFFKDYANDAEYPTVRFVHYGGGSTAVPLDEVEPPFRKDAPWKTLSKSTANEVMSLGFFFAKEITKQVKVPVGLVMVAVSGTPQTAWMPRETMESFPGDGGKGNYYESRVADWDAGRVKAASKFGSFAEYEQQLDAWRKDPAATARSWPGSGDAVISDYPAGLYNTRVHPLIPLAFRGMLWHQGEAGPYGAHGPRMVATVNRERELFGHDFYFIWGTMTRKTTTPPPLDPFVGNLRANISQSMIAGDQLFGEKGRSALVNFIDIGNPGTHWAMKEEGGRRMALAALDQVYGQKSVFTGPQLVKSDIKGSEVTCTFRHAGGGLKYMPSVDGISGFIAFDKAGAAHWADVKITGPDTLIASIPAGEVTALYYAIDANPHETLFNAEGFTAFGFQVGNARAPKAPADAPQLAQITAGGGEKIQLDVAHVRREGYAVGVIEWKGTAGAEVTVKAYVPAEWKGVEVRVGEKVMDVKPVTDAGKQYVTVKVPVNGGRLVVAEPGKAADIATVKRF